MRHDHDRTFFRRTDSTTTQEHDHGVYEVTMLRRNNGRDSMHLFTNAYGGHTAAYFEFVEHVELMTDDDAVTLELTGTHRSPARITLHGITLEQLARAVNAEQSHQSQLALEAALEGTPQ